MHVGPIQQPKPARAAEHCVKGKRQNQSTGEHRSKIIQADQFSEEAARHARRVDRAETEKNDLNLNISRYISTAVGEADIDLHASHQALVDIEKAIAAAEGRHNACLKALDLKPLPWACRLTWRPEMACSTRPCCRNSPDSRPAAGCPSLKPVQAT